MSLSEAFKATLYAYALGLILVTAVLSMICRRKLSVRLDPNEPPLLKPKVPYIGHVIGIVKHQSVYLEKLSAESRMPIATLPIINRKVYFITSPALVQSVFRSPTLSFEPFLVEFSQRALGLSDEAMKPLKAAGDGRTERCMYEILKAVHETLLGEPLHRMISSALSYTASTLDGLGPLFEPESLFAWLRYTMMMATTNALLGTHNPLKTDTSLVSSLSDFNDGLRELILGILPRFFAPKAYHGRATVQRALGLYYLNGYDLEPDVSELIRKRAEIYRKYDIGPIDIGKREISILQISTANAVATTFWMLVYIVSNPIATEAIRQELQSIVVITTSSRNNSRGEAKLDITKLESHCPLIVSAYRETSRIVNSIVSTRRVMEDTVISDGNSSYLLRAGADLQMPAGVTHLSTTIWGPDAASYDFKRFSKSEAKINMGEKVKKLEREQKRAYFPFGGGKHLCPGQSFAFAEILGLVAALTLGFDIRGEDGELIQVPEMRRSRLGEAVAPPSEKGMQMGARITRRKGWENVQWQFVNGKE